MPTTHALGQAESKRRAQTARTFTPGLIDQAKKAQGIPSSYRLTRILGVTDVTMTSWTAGRASPNDSAAIRLAEMAGLDPALVLAEIAVERAQDDESRALWRGIVDRLKNAGLAAIVGAICTFGAPPEAQAYEVGHHADRSDAVRYVNRRKRRRGTGRRKADAPVQRKRGPKGLPALQLH